MSRDYSLSGTRITMRRMFKYDIQEIIKCFDAYNRLFFNPVTAEFVSGVFAYGEFWGAFVNDSLIACSYLYPLECEFSRNETRYSLICDFIPCPKEYLMLGYIGFDDINIEKNIPSSTPASVYAYLYKAFLNIAQMQAFRQGYRFVMHCCPVKLTGDISPLFADRFYLVKMRGLEKLVVHYIFEKDIFNCCNEKQKGDSISVALSNTKTLSRFLENGYHAFDILRDGNENIVFLKNQ